VLKGCKGRSGSILAAKASMPSFTYAARDRREGGMSSKRGGRLSGFNRRGRGAMGVETVEALAWRPGLISKIKYLEGEMHAHRLTVELAEKHLEGGVGNDFRASMAWKKRRQEPTNGGE